MRPAFRYRQLARVALSVTDLQRSVASAYILSFFRRHLLGERQFDAYLQGDLPPPPSTSTNKVKVSYHPPSAERRDVNRLDTQSVFDAERNTLNGVTTDTGLTPYTLCDGSDCLSQTRTGNSYLRLGLGWNSLTASYANAIPSGSRDVSDFATLQFRVGVDHTDSRNGGTARNFRVQLRDGAGDTATARVADFSNALLFPPGGTSSRMSLMSTVRIPVVAFDNIDLDNIVSVNFLFNEQSTGKIFVSDLAFADHGVAGGYWMGNDSRGFSAFDVALGKQFRPFSGNFDDANGDDIFLYAPGSATDLMLWSNGDGTFTTEVVNVGGFYLPIAGDFDGDQADDIFWYAPGSTTDYIWWSDGDRTFTSSTQNVAGDYKPFAGDFDGDGATDIFWYVPGSTADSIWWSDGDRTFTSVSQSVSGTYSPAVGDFDGNGRDDIFWYAPGSASDGIWWWNANRTFTTTAPSVGGTYQLFTGDFDDDGFDDIFWYRPGSASDAVWWWSASRTYVSTTQSVSGTYKIAAGDFDDDGNSDIFWYAP